MKKLISSLFGLSNLAGTPTGGAEGFALEVFG